MDPPQIYMSSALYSSNCCCYCWSIKAFWQCGHNCFIFDLTRFKYFPSSTWVDSCVVQQSTESSICSLCSDYWLLPNSKLENTSSFRLFFIYRNFSQGSPSLSCLSVGWMLQMGDVVIMPYPITEAPPPQSKIHIIIIILNSIVTIFIVGHLLGGWPTMASDFLILFKSTNSNGTTAITVPCNDGNSCIKWESIITIKLSKERGERIYSPLVDTQCNYTQCNCHLLDKHQQLVRSYLQLHCQHRFLTTIKLMIKLDWCFEFSSHYLEFEVVSLVWWSVRDYIDFEIKFVLRQIYLRMVQS